ncbi:PD40 domain-containing protein, partial [bacterium]|nr:PD40 domain-containing protein [bacterium]
TPEGAKLASLERGDAQRISTQFAVISQWVNDRVLIVSDYGDSGNANVMTLDPTSRTAVVTLVESEESEFYGEVSPDGSTLIYYMVNPETGRDLWKVPVSVTDDGIAVQGEPSEWFAGPNDDASPTWHPSGKWVAYMSNETGRFQVYVRSWPEGGVTELVSLDGGMAPLWSEDGSSLYYRDSDSLYVVDVVDKERMRFSRPRGLLNIPETGMILGNSLERSFAVRPGTGELLFFQSNAPVVIPKIILVEHRQTNQ